MPKNDQSWKDKFIKNFGEVFVPATVIAEKKQDIISISPAVDLALGGIPYGVWVILAGQNGVGKTSMALKIATEGQKQYNSEVFYIDAEGRFKKLNLKTIHDLDINKFTLIRSTPEHILSAEENLQIGIEILKNNKNCILIVDSLSALCSEKELTTEITAQSRASTPKLIATFCRQVSNIVPINNSIVICVQHLIANTSGYGSPWVMDGGVKIQFQADVRLRAKSNKDWTDPSGKIVGQTVVWDIEKSALGPPGGLIESYIRYGYGIDEYMECISLALDLGLLNQKGSWISGGILGENKIQGKEQLYNYLIENPDKYEQLYQSIKTMI